jgi:hypothetical protein
MVLKRCLWLAAFMVGAPASAQSLIIWAPITLPCGSNKAREAYRFEAVDAASAFARVRSLTAANGEIASAVIPKGQCVAVGLVEKKVIGCTFTTHMWRTGADADAAEAKLRREMASEVNAKGGTLREVRCAG